MTRRIGAVKMITDGLRGLEVDYETIDVQKDASYKNEHKDKRHRPVHQELKDLLAGLKPYFVDLCGYTQTGCTKEGLEGFMTLVDITGVKAGADKFCITGKVRTWEDKVVGMATPSISMSDGFEAYDDVFKLVDKIYKEADMYMKGDRVAAKKQVVVDYMRIQKKQDGFNYNDFEVMGLEEQEKLLKEMEKDLMITFSEQDGEIVGSVGDTVPAEVVPQFTEFTDDEIPV